LRYSSAAMKTVLFLIAAVLLASVYADCPSGTIQGLSNDACYILNEHGLSWDQAEERCVAQGGHLTSVTSQILNTFLQSALAVQAAPSYWTGGLFNGAIAGQWAWSDGSRWSYTNWAAGQPATDGTICLLFNTTSGSAGNWMSATCATEQPYICRVPPVGGFGPTQPPLPPSLPTREPSKCAANWFSIDNSNLCYFQQPGQTDWATASQQCVAYGGKLASIPNKAINNDLALALLTTSGGQYWIGLSDPSESGVYTWTDGTPLNWTNWAAGQPLSGSQYGYLGADGKWGATGYSDVGYVCEAAPIF
jgi:C-type mannose receptor